MKKTETLIAAKYFGWWFAWGGFSAIMLLIVMKGGGLSFENLLITIFGIGVVSGLMGLCYYLNNRRL